MKVRDGAPQNDQVLDAAVELLQLRRRALDEIARQEEAPLGQIVARDGDLNAWMMADSRTWRTVLSTRATTNGDELRRSMPNNREMLRGGLEMVSLFDFAGTDPAAKKILASEEDQVYFFASAPLQMRIVNMERVYLAGPPGAILSLTHSTALSAALQYWRAVLATAVPCRGLQRAPSSALTQRQECIVELLLQGFTDEAVARAIGRSVRTVRLDVAAAMEVYGARSRAALGFAYAKGAPPPSAG